MCISRMTAAFLLLMLVSLFVGGCTKQVPVEKVEVVPWEQLDDDGDGVRNGEDQCDCTPEGARVNGKGCWVLGMKVLFPYNSYDLTESGKVALEEVIRVLLKNPELSITIVGHTDKFGTQEYNLQLSQKRAEAVMQHLENKGIEKWRLVAIGVGELKADQSVLTKEDGAKDREVEFSPDCFRAL